MNQMLLLTQHESRRRVGPEAGAIQGAFLQNQRMSAPRPKSGWYLPEWLNRKKLLQADVIRALSWERGRVSKIVNGRQAWMREDVLQLSAWLDIEPYELLMPPDEALALRKLRETALAIAADAGMGAEPDGARSRLK